MNLLSIGGSDPSSGAGIQGDVKTFGAHGAYGLTIVTAITSQNTSAFSGAEPVSDWMLGSQIDSVLSDFEISGIKIGMVYTAQAARILSDRLKNIASSGVPIVVDPVTRSTTGGPLMQESALGDYITHVAPLATAMTPNLQEARMLLDAATGGRAIGAKPRHERIAAELARRTGAKHVIITGVARGGTIHDIVATSDGRGTATAARLGAGRRRIETHGETHGGGCMFSASLLCGLASGMTITQSAKAAQRFVMQRMREPTAGAGSGIPILSAPPADGASHAKLADAIKLLTRIRGMHRHIPECQSNFVYAGQRPRSVRDVLGVRGRIVRTGSTVTVAGAVTRGGSKHVATAVVAACKKFPQIRSAINIRYDPGTIAAMRRIGMTVYRYDRNLEPDSTKSGGSSIRWGVLEATRHAASPPDAIFHMGDHGKEPMIIVFGAAPEDVISKISRIIPHAGKR